MNFNFKIKKKLFIFLKKKKNVDFIQLFSQNRTPITFSTSR